MITEDTVLVLGAGASMPYGFPSARKLRDHICDDLWYDPALGFRKHGRRLQALGHPEEHITAFREALYRSGRTSVDAFLEFRPEFIEVGKQAIAYALIQEEIEFRLWGVPSELDWYQYLFQSMNSSFEAFGQNRISFITFNYDRSLEQYLVTCLVNAYGQTKERAAAILRQLQFVHVYGQLGALPWLTGECRPYKHDPTDEAVRISSRGIHIIHEDAANPVELETAKNLLTLAKRVFFLGFGYHRPNMERIGLCSIDTTDKRLAGTRVGVSKQEANQLCEWLDQRMHPHDMKPCGIIEFFRAYYPLAT